MSETAAVAMVDESIEAEQAEQPMAAADLFQYLVQDITTGGDPAAFAGDVIDNFVLVEQPESAQILSFLETDTSILVQLLKASVSRGVEESFTIIDRNGPTFLDAVKVSMKEQLSELAAEASA